jgi:Xaa-Pro dipeptidase
MLDVAKIQDALKEEEIDGWLLYDFRGQNTIAHDVLHTPGGALLTRRWFYFVPAVGEPVALHNIMEPESVAHLPGRKIEYHDRAILSRELKTTLSRCTTVAMEYSPGAALPTLSRVDKGTIEMIEALGPRVVSSAALVQTFLAVLTKAQIDSHYRACEHILNIKDLAFAKVTDVVRGGNTISEFELQQFIVRQIEGAGMITDHAPIVAVNGNAGKPHYEPALAKSVDIKEGDFLLIDLWGQEPKGVFADITWTAFVGDQVPDEIARVFKHVASGRDAAVAAIAEASAIGDSVTGGEADRAARNVITKAGFGAQFVHRTGHSITTALHGPGANLDDFETDDVRPLVEGLCFSVEPGIYLDDFGIRSEINVLMTPNGPEVTTLPLQTEVVPLLAK